MLQTVNALLVTTDNTLLLVQRAQDVDVEPGKWSLPGGRVETGEVLTDALDRELAEELGIDTSSYEKRICFIENKIPQIQSFYYVISMPGEILDIVLAERELSSFEWIYYEKIDMQLAFDQEKIIHRYFSALQKLQLGTS